MRIRSRYLDRVVVRLVLLGVSLALSGCGECGRRLTFFTLVRTSSGAPVSDAAVAITCADADTGGPLTGSDRTSSPGEAAPFIHAMNRPCPEAPQRHASYFRDCTLTATAPGFLVTSRTLTGAELDALPEQSAGQSGHGVRIQLVLLPE